MIKEIEKYGLYEFDIFENYENYPLNKYYTYKIYSELFQPKGVISSLTNFETEQEARFAAIGHISSIAKEEDK